MNSDRIPRKFRPSHATIVAYLALFVALGGSVYAATSNKINGQKIKPNSVPGNRIKKGSLTGTQINSSSLGVVPKATQADKADQAALAAKATLADNADKLAGAPSSAYLKGSDAVGGSDIGGTYASPTLKASEPMRLVGTAGNPEYKPCNTPYKWEPPGTGASYLGFYRDQLGVVHLQGSVHCGTTPTSSAAVFELPPGYRTAPGQGILLFTSYWFGSAQSVVQIGVDSQQHLVYVSGPTSGGDVSLSGISFRCAPSGVAGCP